VARRLIPRGWATRCAHAIDRLVFPRTCVLCESDGDRSGLCPDCRAELLDAAGPTCSRCASPIRGGAALVADEAGCPLCRGRPLGFDAAVALAPYQGPVRHLCLRLKHRPQAWLAPVLVGLLMEARGDALRAWHHRDGASEARLVAVPLHWLRRWRRGYNQAEALAESLAAALRLPMARPLRRTRPTRTLAGLGRTERAREMRRAFRIPPRCRPAVSGRDVILVDDILTTGATCGAAARALKRAGARRVMAVVIGRAEGLPP
jgi:ComF family protein